LGVLNNSMNPKTIIISGAHSNIGKTTLAQKLCGILPDSLHIKIGHGVRKNGMNNIFYQKGTPLKEILSANNNSKYLIIESNSILNEIEPDCVIYLPGDNPKPSAVYAAKRADITGGKNISSIKFEELCEKLNLSEEIMESILIAVDVKCI